MLGEEMRSNSLVFFLLLLLVFLLPSGIFAANFVNIAEPALLSQMGKDRNSYVKLLSQIIIHKLKSGSAAVDKIPACSAQSYIDLFEKMLQRFLIKKDSKIFQFIGDYFIC